MHLVGFIVRKNEGYWRECNIFLHLRWSFQLLTTSTDIAVFLPECYLVICALVLEVARFQ
jgi:hypothetical protein